MTPPSVFIQENYGWFIPAVQSIHIVAIAMLMGSVLMITLRLMGWAGTDVTMQQNTNRFGPWLTGSLWVLLASGSLLIVGEPVRELITFSFWAKMTLVVIGATIAWMFRRSLRKHEPHWGDRLGEKGSVRFLAIFTLLIWCCIIILGRLIAYDHVWGVLSPAEKA